MASPFDGIDLDDPCAVTPILNKLCFELTSGKATASARFGEDERQFVKGDLARLERMLRDAQAACAAKQAGRPAPRRRAFTAGFRCR